MAAYGPIDECIQLVNRGRLPGSHGRHCVICRLQCKLKSSPAEPVRAQAARNACCSVPGWCSCWKAGPCRRCRPADVDRLQRVIILRLGACTVRGRGAEVDIKLGALRAAGWAAKGSAVQPASQGHIGRLLHRLLLDGRGLLLREAAGVRNDIVHRVVRAVCGIG